MFTFNQLAILNLLIIILLFSSKSHGQKALETREFGQTLSFQSKALAGERKLDIYLPDSYRFSTKTYPVIYLLDSDFLFDLTVSIMKTKWSRELAPEAIIIGVRTSSHEDRLSFAMPIVRPDGSIFGKQAKPKAMADFLKHELSSFVDTHYRTNDYKIGIGMSPTATNIIYDYLQDHSLFDAHIAIASDLHYLMRDGTPIYQTILNKKKEHAFFFHSKASEDFSNDTKGYDIYERLTTLNGQQGLHTYIPENTEHYEVAISTLNKAISTLFPIATWKPNYQLFKTAENPAKQIKSFYQIRNKRARFNSYPLIDGYWTGNSMIGLTRYLAGQNRFVEAAELLEWVNMTIPNDIQVNYFLSRVYTRLEAVEKAKLHAQKAVLLAQKKKSQDLEMLEENLKAITN